jgi:formylglycine-generating enzyme required for sulfatase activity
MRFVLIPLTLGLSLADAPLRAETGPYRPGAAFTDCADCPEMVVVPKGDFIMGSTQEERTTLGVPAIFDKMESPRHMVSIGYKFAVARYAVTFAQWDGCVADGGCDGYRPDDAGWGRGRRPVINVDFANATAYVSWLRKKTGQPYRLLSEAEWEYAGRGGTTGWWYFGNEINTDKANYGKNSNRTAPVGSYPPNPFGLYDMSGNTAQWTQDCYHNGYTGAPVDGSAWLAPGPTDPGCSRRNVRGGGWDLQGWSVRIAQRIGDPVAAKNWHLGFRVARDLPQ